MSFMASKPASSVGSKQAERNAAFHARKQHEAAEEEKRQKRLQQLAAVPAADEATIKQIEALTVAGSTHASPSHPASSESTSPAKRRSKPITPLGRALLFADVFSHVCLFLDAHICAQRLTLVCREWNLMLATDQHVWRSACRLQFLTHAQHQCVTQKMIQHRIAEQAKLQSLCESHYEVNWRRMFAQRPAVRLDGVYVLTTTYHATPATGSNAKVVTTSYYRYLHFHAHRVVHYGLLNAAPPEPLSFSHPLSESHKSLHRGTYKYRTSDEGETLVDVVVDVGHMLALLRLKVETLYNSLGKGSNNQLCVELFEGVYQPQHAHYKESTATSQSKNGVHAETDRTHHANHAHAHAHSPEPPESENGNERNRSPIQARTLDSASASQQRPMSAIAAAVASQRNRLAPVPGVQNRIRFANPTTTFLFWQTLT